MTTPDQNEARREAIQSLGDVISELPGILHPYNTATAVYAAGWRPPLSTPEASDDERYEDSADYAGSVEWLRDLGVVPVAAKMFLNNVIKSARRGPVPADTPSEGKHGADWSDWGIDHPEEGPSCKCGFNGTPEECAAARPTPPEAVAAQAIRDAADAWHAEHKGTKPLVYSWLWNYAAALSNPEEAS